MMSRHQVLRFRPPQAVQQYICKVRGQGVTNRTNMLEAELTVGIERRRGGRSGEPDM